MLKRLALLLLLLGLAACGDAMDHGSMTSAAAAVNVTVNASDFVFAPAQIEVAAGQTIKVTMENSGTQDHDFTIQAIPLAGEAHGMGTATDDHMHSAASSAVHVALKAGTTGTVEFTPTEAGVYTFDCTVPGHKAAGMVGQLTVKAP